VELSANHYDDLYYHFGMAMTLRLPAELDDDLRAAAEEDRRSVHQTVVLAIELFLAARETAQVKADPEALRALAEARQAVRDGDVVYGTEAVRGLLRGRRAS
jgi:predicted transcriptional regulator